MLEIHCVIPVNPYLKDKPFEIRLSRIVFIMSEHDNQLMYIYVILSQMKRVQTWNDCYFA